MKEKEQNNLWELAAARLHNELSENDEELNSLLEEESNARLYNNITSLKKDVGETKGLSVFSKNRSWKRVSKQIHSKTIKLIWSVTKYAAIIVFAFLLGIIIPKKHSETEEITRYAQVSVPLGQMSEMTLYDGTRVWLNSGTTLQYDTDFGKNERNVSIVGEAFFDVTKTGTPFRVHFKNKVVEVLGTRFNVVAYEDEKTCQVTLVEGSVKVNQHGGNTIATLEPAEQLTIDEPTQKAFIETVETNFYVSWTEGKILFEEERLKEISQKLARWYNVDIQFENTDLLDLEFSGTILKSKPLSQAIKVFELLLPVKIKYTHVPGGKDVVFISKKTMPM